MDFVYVEDIARANILAMKSDREDDVYNVASGTRDVAAGPLGGDPAGHRAPTT